MFLYPTKNLKKMSLKKFIKKTCFFWKFYGNSGPLFLKKKVTFLKKSEFFNFSVFLAKKREKWPKKAKKGQKTAFFPTFFRNSSS